MVALWCWGVKKIIPDNASLRKAFIIQALIWTAYGIAMEFVQKYFIPFRSFDVGDIVADAAGCGIGLVYCIRSRRYIKK